VCHTDIATRVTFLSQLAGEELVELSTENTIGDELSLFADLDRHSSENKLRFQGIIIGKAL
jgi:hypothetical protein